MTHIFNKKLLLILVKVVDKNLRNSQFKDHKFTTHINFAAKKMNLEESKRLIEELIKTNEDLEKVNISQEMEVKASYKIINKLINENKLLKEYEEAIKEKYDLIQNFEIEKESLLQHHSDEQKSVDKKKRI